MTTLNNFSLKNDFILLEGEGVSSVFAPSTDAYVVILSYNDEIPTGTKLYLHPGQYQTVKVEGNELVLARLEDVIGCVDE